MDNTFKQSRKFKYIGPIVLMICLFVGMVPEIKAQELPEGYKYHTVKKGQSLYGIARSYRMTLGEIKRINTFESDNLFIGQKVVVFDRRSVQNDPRYNNYQLPNEPIVVNTGDIGLGLGDPDVDKEAVRAEGGVSRGASLEESNAYGRVVSSLDVLSPKGSKGRLAGKSTARGVKPLTPEMRSEDLNGQPLVEERTTLHVVKNGENFFSIAETYGIREADLRAWNEIDELIPGKVLIVGKWYEEIDPEVLDRQIAEGVSRGSGPNGRSDARLVGSLSQFAGKQADIESRSQLVVLPSTANGEKETGFFARIKVKDNGGRRFYAAHKSLPLGMEIKVEIPEVGLVNAMVVHRLPADAPVMVGLSPIIVKMLKTEDKNRQVSIFY